MPIQLIGASGDVAEAGNRNYNAGASQHVQVKPITYTALGHYRTVARTILPSLLVANARLFEVRNAHAANLIVPLRLQVRLAQVAAGTAQIAGLDIFKLTSFSVVDPTNALIPTASAKRTPMAIAPSSAVLRVGAATSSTNGITGGTMTKDAAPFWQLSYPVAAAAATSTAGLFGPYDVFDDVNGSHPFTLGPNEGFEIENRTLNTTSFGVELSVDFSWAEVTTF